MSKKITSLLMMLGLFMSSSAFAQLEEFGENTLAIGGAITELKTNTWYYLFQGRGDGQGVGNYQYCTQGEIPNNQGGLMTDCGVGNQVLKMDYNPVLSNVTAETAAPYLVRFVEVEEGTDRYNIQFGTGDWLTAPYGTGSSQPMTVGTIYDAGTYNVYNIESGTAYFALNVSDSRGDYQERIDNNGTGHTIVTWQSGLKTNVGGNSVWSIHEVVVTELDKEGVQKEWDETKTAAEVTIANSEYANVTGDERTALGNAIAAAPSTDSEYEEAVAALNAATAAFTAAKANYDLYATERALANAISTDITVAAPTTAAEALTQFRALKVAEYNYVATNYAYSATSKFGEFSEWTRTGTVNGVENNQFLENTSQHWSGTTKTYYEQPAYGWNNNAWTANYTKTITLPAGNYIIKVAARAVSGNETTAKITCSATTLDSPIFNSGDTGKGITTDGIASFDEGTFANDGNGYGWVWNYLPFTLSAETEVTMAVVAEATSIYQWFSICDGELLFDNDIQEEESPEWNGETRKVYIQNVASGLWWGAGNTWGTQASLLPHPEYVKLIKNGDGTYKMESQVSMGDTQYYFSGDYMDSYPPINLNITQEGEYYTISSVSDEGDYHSYGFNGSTVLGKDVEEDTDEALWKIYTEEEMMSMMDNATIENPVDATFLILDPNFGRNNRNVGSWNMVASQQNLSGGNNDNNCAVSNRSTFTLSQTLNDIPNGIYAMKAQGFYRQYVADDVNLPVFYANEETAVFSTCISSETTMSAASESFTKGFYTIDPIFVEVTDGQLIVGARLENNTESWCLWDNFELYYYGSSVSSVYAVNLAYFVNEATALESKLPNAAWQHLYAIVQQYNKEYNTAEEYTNAIETIRTAIEESKRVGSVYAEFLSMIDNAENIVSALDFSTDESYVIWCTALVAANEDVMDAESEEDIQELILQVRRATVDAIAASNITEPIDITSISLKNPDFEDGTINGWVCTFVSGETATNIGYQIGYGQTSPYTNGDVNIFHFIEAWQQNTTNKKAVGDGLLYQTVYGLPMGRYRLVTDAIAVDQYQGNNPVEGTYIYIESGLLETKTEIATGNGLPEHFEVDFINDQADFLTFGLKTESTTANWIAADNFRIYFVEALTESPGVTVLKEELETYANVTFGPCNAEILAAFEEELEKAAAMTTTDIYSAAHSSECIAERDVLAEKYDAVLNSVYDYECIQDMLDTIDDDEDMEYPVNIALKEYKDAMQQKLDEGTATAEDNDGYEQIDAINEYWEKHLAEADIVSLRASLDEMDPIDEEKGVISSWENRWDLDAEELSLDGVYIQGGRVLDIDLSNHGLKGQFPASLLGLTKLEWLDISYNELTGNIGAVNANCPNLWWLDASYNHFTSVVPALPTTISNLCLCDQQLPITWELNLNQMGSEDIVSQLPSILFYRHGYDPNTYLSVAAETESGWQTGIYYENGNITFYPADYSQPYTEENGATFTLTCDYGSAYGSTFSMRLYFAQGDANFTGDVNVLDLQTIIEYIFNEYYDIFNFTAANLYVDDRINVQDVVRMVDVILEDEEEAGVKALAFRQRKANMEQPAQATLYWRGDELVLETEVPVAAVDIRITGNAVTWNLQKSGFTVTEKNTGDRSRAIIYSLNGATIPVGENVIATKGGNMNSDILTAMLSTREGTNIPVAIAGQEETSINRLIAADSAWTLTSVGGTTVAKGIGQSQFDETTRNLTKGIYILNTKQHTMKVTIK